MVAGFPKHCRILTKRDFSAVFDSKQRVHGRCVTLFYRAVAEQQPRIGLAVSKKVDKRAVARNAIKRQIREWFRLKNSHQTFFQQHAESATLPNLEMVVVAKPGCQLVDSQTLRSELDYLSKKAARRCAAC